MSRADGPAGAGANGNSSEPSISANGRWVAFQSAATNLAPGVTEGVEHVYVRDLLSGTTRLVDRADGPDGAIANDELVRPVDRGRSAGSPVVAFASVADNLDGGDRATSSRSTCARSRWTTRRWSAGATAC